MTIGEKIRLTRQNKKISQTELSKKSGVPYKSLSRYELGLTMPPADALNAIANTLGVSADYLLNDENVTIKDKELFMKFEILQNIDSETKKMINNFLDLIIRDFKTKNTYAL